MMPVAGETATPCAAWSVYGPRDTRWLESGPLERSARVGVDPFELIVEDIPDPEHVRQVVAGLVAYNASQAGPSSHKPLGVFLRVHDRIVGGADGYTHWQWLYVSHLWVDDAVRQQGAGRQVMAMMEDAARDRGCQAAWLDTFSFQALGFYQALGYRLFGELRDYPRGYSRHFLWKALDKAGP
jgi:ribosomal protein S18 acetylase RimI-like enzyme